MGLNVRNAAAEAIGMGRRVNKYFREGQKQKLLTQKWNPVVCVWNEGERATQSKRTLKLCSLCLSCS